MKINISNSIENFVINPEHKNLSAKKNIEDVICEVIILVKAKKHSMRTEL